MNTKMLKILVYLFCFICLIHGENETVPNRTEPVKTGKKVEPGEHPYAVYIPKARCAGTLVRLGTVMSACHCFYGQKSEGWEVLAGVLNLNDKSKSSSQTRKILNVVLHPKCRKKYHLIGSNNQLINSSVTGFYNDIAKIILDRPFEPTKEVRTAEIISRSKDEFKKDWEYNILDNDIACYSMGWKCKDVKCEGKDSGVLTAVSLIHMPRSRCEQKVPLGEKSMCRKGQVLLVTSGKTEDIITNNVYSGDSGGPLICAGLSYGVNTIGLGENVLKNETYFLLFWPYLDFVGDWTLRSHSSALFQHHLLVILTTFYYLYF